MLRNKYFEREKEWRRADKRADELSDYKWAIRYSRYGHSSYQKRLDEHILWVPLEKPVFAGWEVWIELSEAGKRRRDAPRLMEIINLLGVGESNTRFISNSRQIRLIRAENHSYVRIEGRFRGRYKRRGWVDHYGLERIFLRSISKQTYNNLSADLKTFFYADWYEKWKNQPITTYHLNREFPLYELVFKVKKSYNTFVGHLYGDKIGEYEKLRDWLWSYETVHERKNIGYHESENRQWRRWNSSLKRGWRDTMHELTKAANSLGHDHEEWIEIEEHVERQTKIRAIPTFGRW